MQIKRLDHIALNVSNLESSVDWYTNTLGMERMTFEKWGNRPTMMRGGTGLVALFQQSESGANNAGFHFAFSVSIESLSRFKSHFTREEIPFTEEDHYYFRSIYLRDPDGHQVELTAPVESTRE